MVPEPMERNSEVEVETPGAEKLWGKLRDGFTNAGDTIRKATTKMTPPWLVPGSSLPEGPEYPEAADSPGASSEVTLEADAQQSQALIYLINHAISHREAQLKEGPSAGGHLSVISASDLREALLKQAADGDASAGQKWCESGDGAMPKLGVATMGALLNLASCPPDEEREEPMPGTAPTAEPVTGGPHAATLTATPKAGSTLRGRTPFMPPTFEAVGSLPTAFPLGFAGDNDQISFTYSYDEEEPGLARAGSAATPLSSSAPGASDCAPAPRQHAVPKASCSFAHSRSRWQTRITTTSRTWRRPFIPRGRRRLQQQQQHRQQHPTPRRWRRDVRDTRPAPTPPNPMCCGPTPCEALPCSPVPCGPVPCSPVHGGA